MVEEKEFKEVKCKSCGTKKMPLFMRSPPRDKEDVYCKPCMDQKKHME